MLAAKKGFPEAVRVLLDNGASHSVSLCENESDDESGYLMIGAQPLHACLYRQQNGSERDITTMVRYLLDAGASLLIRDVDGDTPLKLALRNHHFEAAKLLLERAISLNSTYLEISRGKDPDQEAFLNDSDCEDDEDGDNDEDNDSEDEGSDEDEDDTPLLHLAAQMAAVEIIDMLVKMPDCDVNERSSYKQATPLHFACQGDWEFGLYWNLKHSKQVVVKLLAHGADPTLVDSDHHSPLYWLSKDSKDPEISILQEFAR